MPKTPKDFGKRVIYRIVCRDLQVTDCYVGSTTNFDQRKASHRYACLDASSAKNNLKVYVAIRNNGGWDNWDVVVVENYPCANKNELHTRERFHMEQLGATLNRKTPTRTLQEYREEHKEEMAEYCKV